jgi:predicted dithiol-disulfide oxidoreductase (DUF899 family)
MQLMPKKREEWLAGRLELLKAEKELTRRSDKLAAAQAICECSR